MKPLSQLNSKLMHELTMADLRGDYAKPGQDDAERKRVQEFLETLPSFTGNTVLQIQKNVEWVQAHVLGKWIGKSMDNVGCEISAYRQGTVSGI